MGARTVANRATMHEVELRGGLAADIRAGMRSDVADRKSALDEILLMVLFGGVKGCGRLNRGCNRLPKAAAAFEPLLRGPCCGQLAGILAKDHGPVLVPDVRSLAVYLRWVVTLPEHVQERVETDLVGFERHPDDLGMSSVAAADLFVGGVGTASTRVTHDR